MCIASPARVLALEAGSAVIDVGGRRRCASLLRDPDVEIGDWVLVAAGTVIRRIDPDEARDLDRLLRTVTGRGPAPAVLSTADGPTGGQP